MKNEAKTFGDWAYVAIAKHFHKILKHESGVLADRDPEELHQMRVGMRRLRSALIGFAPALDWPATLEQRKIGKVARVLGQLRDIDVLIVTLKHDYYPQLPTEEQQALGRVLKRLRKQRKPNVQRVGSILQEGRYLRLCRELADWLAAPKYLAIAEFAIEAILPELLSPHISQLVLHPGWLVGVEMRDRTPHFMEFHNSSVLETLLKKQELCLHDLRKTAKRIRYQMELFEQFYGDNYQSILKDIRAIQTVLGSLQDSFVLKKFLSRAVDNKLSQTMPIFANKINEDRLQLWQEWGQLQRHFLALKTRQDLHRSLLWPLSTSFSEELNSSSERVASLWVASS